MEREGREGEGKKGRKKEGRVRRKWRVKTVLPHVKQAVAAYACFWNARVMSALAFMPLYLDFW